MKITKKVNHERIHKATTFLEKFASLTGKQDFLGTRLVDFSDSSELLNTLLEQEWKVTESEESVVIDKYSSYCVVGMEFINIGTSTKTVKVYMVKTLDGKFVVLQVKPHTENTYTELYMGYSGKLNEFFSFMSEMNIRRNHVEEYYIAEGMPVGFSMEPGITTTTSF